MQRIDYMTVGAAYNTTDKQKAKINRVIEDLEWLAMPKKGESLSLPIMPGEAIKSAIKELKIPKVSHIAISHEMAPYGFYGIRGHYKNADVDAFFLDEGSRLVTICTYVTEKTI